MKRPSILIPLLFIAVSIQAGIEVPAKITSVLVYADRARVHRSGEIDLPAGRSELRVSGLPGWIEDDSVRVALQAAGVRITDVRIERTHLARSGDEDVRKAESDVREIEDKIADLNDEYKIQEAKKRQIGEIQAFSMDKLPRDTAIANVSIDSYGKTVEFVADKLRAVAVKEREISRALRELSPEMTARRKRADDVRQRQQLDQCAVVVQVESAGTAKAKLDIDYMTPGAVWEPVHELRSDPARPGKVTVVSYALVSQTTGEEWNSAELGFSTQSPDVLMQVPELSAMRLDEPEAAAAAASQGSFEQANKNFKEQNAAYNMVMNDTKSGDYDPNLQRQEQVQERVATVFSELRLKRGTTAHFSSEDRPPVRSDGRQVRVRIGQIELPAERQIIAAPQISLNAVNTVEMTNLGHQPILPGKAAIFNANAFLGTTDLKFVAEGEKFSALMGVADRVKLTRSLDRRRSSLVSGGDRKRMQAVFDVTVENLGADPVRVRLQDRIPVSGNKEIRVSSVEIAPDGKPDEKGLLVWNLTLAGNEKKVFHIGYIIEYPASEGGWGRKSKGYLSPAPEASPAYDEAPLRQQIDELEKTF